jgi:hypothetical protein
MVAIHALGDKCAQLRRILLQIMEWRLLCVFIHIDTARTG